MRVEIQRINGDIYINGQKRLFAVDFNKDNPSADGSFDNVDWLIGWAKIGLLKSGHDVPCFEVKGVKAFGDTQPMVGETHGTSV